MKKIAIVFLVVIFLVVGCSGKVEPPEELLEEDIIEETEEESEKEGIIGETNREKEILDLAVPFYAGLIGKNLQEVEKLLEGEDLDFEGEVEEGGFSIFLHDRRVGIRFENHLVGWILFFEDVNFLGLKTAPDTTQEEVLAHFGEPDGKGPFEEKGEYYEYYISDMIVVFFFTPHYEEVLFSIALFKE